MEVQLRKIEVPDWSVGQCAFRLLSEDLAIFDSAAGGDGFSPGDPRWGGHCSQGA